MCRSGLRRHDRAGHGGHQKGPTYDCDCVIEEARGGRDFVGCRVRCLEIFKKIPSEEKDEASPPNDLVLAGRRGERCAQARKRHARKEGPRTGVMRTSSEILNESARAPTVKRGIEQGQEGQGEDRQSLSQASERWGIRAGPDRDADAEACPEGALGSGTRNES